MLVAARHLAGDPLGVFFGHVGKELVANPSCKRAVELSESRHAPTLLDNIFGARS